MDFQEHPKSKLLSKIVNDILPDTKTLQEYKITKDCRLIPIYEVFRDPKVKSNVFAKSIFTNNFSLLMENELGKMELMTIDYEIFEKEQIFKMELEEQTKELIKTDSAIELDDTVGNNTSPEEEMTSIRANELYAKIMDAWDNIVLGKKTGDFDKDQKLEFQQQDFYSIIVYEMAWEVNDIITNLVEGGYQKETLFGNYKEIYVSLQSKNGKECARELVRLARLMSRCVSPMTTQRTEDIVESIMPSNANIRDA